MTSATKCCGTCRWFKSWADLGNGDCWAPIPWSAESVHKHHMRNNDGSHCPCHAPREGEPPTDKETTA